jgi:uncharacterized protein
MKLEIKKTQYPLDLNRTVYVLETEQWIPAPIEKVFAFFQDEKNLEILTPDLLNFKVLQMNTPTIQKLTHIDYKLKVHGLPIRWKTEIRDWNPPHLFSDYQLKGPYCLWHHFHHFSEKDGGTLMADQVYFQLPFGMIGNFFGGWFVRKDVRAIFSYRFKKIESLFPKNG